MFVPARQSCGSDGLGPFGGVLPRGRAPNSISNFSLDDIAAFPFSREEAEPRGNASNHLTNSSWVRAFAS